MSPATLTIDLRHNAGAREASHATVTPLAELTALAHRPAAPLAAPRQHPRGELSVLLDDLPISGVQAAVILLAAIVPRDASPSH